MTDPQQVCQALRVLAEQMRELELPESADEVNGLAGQLQQLLEAYIQSVHPSQLDRQLLIELMDENQRLMAVTARAHGEAAEELDSLALGRSAVSAYQEIAPASIGV